MSRSATVPRSLTVRSIDSVHASDSIRHVDQLSESALDSFYEAVESGGPIAAVDESGFERGEVVVSTEYYRIEFC